MQEEVSSRFQNHLETTPQGLRDRIQQFESSLPENWSAERIFREKNSTGNVFKDETSVEDGVEYWKVDTPGGEYVVPQPQTSGFRETAFSDGGEISFRGPSGEVTAQPFEEGRVRDEGEERRRQDADNGSSREEDGEVNTPVGNGPRRTSAQGSSRSSRPEEGKSRTKDTSTESTPTEGKFPSGFSEGDGDVKTEERAEIGQDETARHDAARAVAASEMLQERAAWEERLKTEFETRAVERFEDPEQARKAYRENMIEVGERRAREVMIRPEDHFEGGGENKAWAYPGRLATTSPEEEAKLQELNGEIERVEKEIEVLKGIRRDAEAQTGEGREPKPEPGAEVVNEAIRNIEEEVEEESVASKANRIADLVGRKQEADRLERERDMLEEAMKLEGETLGERAENAREEAQDAKDEFIESLDQVYENPLKAAINFESVAEDEGFDEAAATLAHAPEELGQLREGETISWETQDFVATEPGRRTAAETYVRAPESEVQKAAKWTLAEAKKAELDLQNAMHRKDLSREEVYRRAGARTRKKADQAAQVIQRADREHSKIRQRLGVHPSDRYEGDLEAERESAGSDTVAKLKEKGQSEEAPDVMAGSAAMTVEKRREALREGLKEIYMSPQKAEESIEARAFADGISTETDSFKETVQDAGKDLSTFGTTDMQFGSLEGRRSNGSSGYQRSKSRRFLDMTRYARIAGEIGEEVVEQGPDQETEEAMKKIRTAFKGTGAAGVIVGVAAAKGAAYGYQTIREGMDRQAARMEMQQRIKDYGEALETYKNQKREATGEGIEERLDKNEGKTERDHSTNGEPSRDDGPGPQDRADTPREEGRRAATEAAREKVEAVKKEAQSDAIDARRRRASEGSHSAVMDEVAEMREGGRGTVQGESARTRDTGGRSSSEQATSTEKTTPKQDRGGRGGRR